MNDAAENAFAPQIPVRLALQQRVLPSYRVPFLDTLAHACPMGLHVFAGQPRAEEMIESSASLEAAHYTPALNRHLLRGSFYLCWQSGLIDWLKDCQPGALIVEANPRYLRTPAAIRWMHTCPQGSARPRGPVLGWGLGAPPIQGKLAGLRQTNRQRFLKHFDALLTYSQQGAEQYHAAGFPADRIFVARNAVSARPIKPAPDRSPNYPNGHANLLFVGRLQSRKRIDILLRACAALPETLRPHLVIVGDGPARGELQDLARRIYPQTEFPGARNGVDLEPYFLQADLFVLPGSGGLAVQQAMSYALPVMVAEGDGTQSDLLRPENGWNLPAGDQNALTTALQTALAHPEHLRSMGLASYKIVTEEINLENMAAVFVRAVNSVL